MENNKAGQKSKREIEKKKHSEKSESMVTLRKMQFQIRF